MKFYNVFSGALSGKTREAYIRNIEDRVFNSLHSYWYLRGYDDEKIIDAFKLTKGNIMIDSGAFTSWTKGISVDVDGYIDYNAFKLYFLDVGLLAAKNNLNIQTILEGNKIFVEYKGSLTEQYVLGEIKSNYNVPINYWSNDAGQSEVDFVIQCNNEIIPIEVKAEENLQSKSLKVLVEKYKTKNNVRTSMTDYKRNDWIINIPLYCIGNIEKMIIN